MQILNDYIFLNNEERNTIKSIIANSDITIYYYDFKKALTEHLRKHNFISQDDLKKLQDIATKDQDTQFLTDLFFNKGINFYFKGKGGKYANNSTIKKP